MLAFAGLAPKLIAPASHRASKALIQAATNHAAVWVEPCSGVTDAVVAKSVGRPVFKYQTGSQDTCHGATRHARTRTRRPISR